MGIDSFLDALMFMKCLWQRLCVRMRADTAVAALSINQKTKRLPKQKGKIHAVGVISKMQRKTNTVENYIGKRGEEGERTAPGVLTSPKLATCFF